MEIFEKRKDSFLISTNRELLNLDFCHKMIFESYWAKGIPLETFRKSVENSLCFGIYKETTQVGFARVISDYSTFAYLGDVVVDSSYRGNGLGKWFMASILDHPDLQGLRRFCLGTKDAHGLYEKFGFKVIETPENWMEIKIPNIYLNE